MNSKFLVTILCGFLFSTASIAGDNTVKVRLIDENMKVDVATLSVPLDGAQLTKKSVTGERNDKTPLFVTDKKNPCPGFIAVRDVYHLSVDSQLMHDGKLQGEVSISVERADAIQTLPTVSMENGVFMETLVEVPKITRIFEKRTFVLERGKRYFFSPAGDASIKVEVAAD